MGFSTSLISAYTQSDLFGKAIFWALFLLSSLSWTFLIQRIWMAFLIKKQNAKVGAWFEKQGQALLSSRLEEKLVGPFYEIHKELQSKTQEVLEKNRYFSENKQQVFLSSADIELIGSHLNTTLLKKARLLEKHLFLLPTVVTLGPFLGLLGTVWGILVTFSHLKAHSLSQMNAFVLSGLSMALATTVAGLLVAIPALVAYNYIKNEIQEIKKDMSHFTQDLITHLEMQYRKPL